MQTAGYPAELQLREPMGSKPGQNNKSCHWQMATNKNMFEMKVLEHQNESPGG